MDRRWPRVYRRSNVGLVIDCPWNITKDSQIGHLHFPVVVKLIITHQLSGRVNYQIITLEYVRQQEQRRKWERNHSFNQTYL